MMITMNLWWLVWVDLFWIIWHKGLELRTGGRRFIHWNESSLRSLNSGSYCCKMQKPPQQNARNREWFHSEDKFVFWWMASIECHHRRWNQFFRTKRRAESRENHIRIWIRAFKCKHKLIHIKISTEPHGVTQKLINLNSKLINLNLFAVIYGKFYRFFQIVPSFQENHKC